MTGTSGRGREEMTYPIAIGRVAKSQYKERKGQVSLRELDTYWLLVTLTKTMAHYET